MSFDFEKKRTPKEIRQSLLLCAADAKCEDCCFYEAEAPRGYSPCHEWLMLTQAAQYIWELMVLKNIAEGEIPEENSERTAKVKKVDMPSEHNKVYKCMNCGQYMHRTAWANPIKYCSNCGSKLEWE